ncbi:MAG: hypothetical protein IJC71_01820 [Clostridia bacterium]|nr:hypothetical protein [Clostridia bacterium]
MLEKSDVYAIKKLQRGIPVEVEVLPRHRKPVRMLYEPNKNSDDARVCLSCTEKKCRGGDRCYAKRRDALLAAARKRERDA